MKKILLLFLLTVFSSVLLLSEPVFYRSDSVGLELEIINKYRLDEFEYVLEVNKTSKKIEKKTKKRKKKRKKESPCLVL